MRDQAILNYKMFPDFGSNLGEVVPVGKQLDIWGDVETEVMILNDGDESLCLGYEDVHFYHDLYVGDQVDFKATMVKIGNTSRKVKLETYKIATPARRNGRPDAAEYEVDVLDPPLLCSEGYSVLVVKKSQQRGVQPEGIVADPWAEVETLI